ncbi:MAG: fibronectin type III domain-containing protein [Chitinophagaceae bacterium]|nr:fibronectin type III domain-containing protein [Chitinophagaceae bacterium]
MKKIFTLLLILPFYFAAKSQLLTENFSYTAGQLLTANGWTAHSGAGTNAITVTSPGLTYAGHPGSGVGNGVTMTTSGEDDNKTFTAVTSGTVYISFLVNVSAATATGDYFVGLLTSASSFPVRIYAKSDGAGGYFFGIGKNAAAAVYETTQRTFGTTYFVVGNYIYNTGTTTDDAVNLWVNPALGGSEPAATIPNVTGANTDVTTIGAVYLRQGTAANASTQQVDAILAGTTWAQVTPSAAVPTLSVTPFTPFGNVCINTTAGPNSFTINGSNLTNANITVSALAGYTYSTTAGGTYTASLSLPQGGGTYSQQIFVQFTPTAVQSYNGNIFVGGGGATPIVFPVPGAGINDMPTVTTGGSSAVTQTTATCAGSIPSIGCSAISAYGIEYSTTAGFANGTGTPVTSSNLSGGNFTSNLSGLTASTTYYYHAYATNGAGTAYGSEQSFTTASPNPTITTSALAAFGNVCINTTAGPNSFTITGSNLTSANVDLAALAGFTYSTTSGGTYTTTLSLPQPGGSYSQQIFVRFNPTAVQSYNGNIVISGGGLAANVNVAASGSGVNTAPSVTTGAASAITQTTATAAGTITATGCTSVTAYGIEYSLTNGFANGTGTQVVSSNLSGGNFTSNLTGLTSNTTYYYKAYATNGGGTTWGAQQSFTTLPPVLSATALTPFGNVCINNAGGPNSFTISGTGLSNANVTVAALAGFTYSTASGGTYTTTLSIPQPGGAFSQQIFVRFSPTAVQSYNGNIVVGGGGANNINVAASGDGVNTLATVVTGAATNINTFSATLAGRIAANGCSNVTAYGIEYSGINGFISGNGSKVASGNLTSGSFSSSLTGLVQGATYYYKAYATNSGGTSYGLQQSFTVASIANEFTFYPSPVSPGGEVRVTMNNIAPGHYGVLIFNSDGKLVYQKDMNIQVNFINQAFTIPGHLPGGIYRVQLINHLDILSTKTVLIL